MPRVPGYFVSVKIKIAQSGHRVTLRVYCVNVAHLRIKSVARVSTYSGYGQFPTCVADGIKKYSR